MTIVDDKTVPDTRILETDVELWHKVVLSGVFGAGTAFFGPAFDAIDPGLVPDDELNQANSLDQLVRPAALRMLGPALGGWLVDRSASHAWVEVYDEVLGWRWIDATPESDIDLLVDLMPGGGNELVRVAGIAEELSELLGTRVDVVAASLLRGEVSAGALADSVAV